jgi:hypothetical protein
MLVTGWSQSPFLTNSTISATGSQNFLYLKYFAKSLADKELMSEMKKGLKTLKMARLARVELAT